MSNRFLKHISYFKEELCRISPQLEKRLKLLVDHLEKYDYDNRNCSERIVKTVSSLFSRLLLELIQAHYNTRQRVGDAVRLIESKNCTLEPALTDIVINLLIKLYQPSGIESSNDISYERLALIELLWKKVRNEYGRRQVEKVIQTFYRCSCFEIIQREGCSSLLKLKKELQDPFDLRNKHDLELIKLVQENHIRLPPESWAYLLYDNPTSKHLSTMQSFLDKDQNPVTVEELQSAISGVGDKYNIQSMLGQLGEIKDCILAGLNTAEEIENLLIKLIEITPLFSIRQNRGKFNSVSMLYR